MAGFGSVGMAWTWRYEDAQGGAVDGPNEAFASQSDAESWIGQSWRELSANGVLRVALYEENRLEYRMSLTPAASD
jgi:hypothetical protein